MQRAARRTREARAVAAGRWTGNEHTRSERHRTIAQCQCRLRTRAAKAKGQRDSLAGTMQQWRSRRGRDLEVKGRPVTSLLFWPVACFDVRPRVPRIAASRCSGWALPLDPVTPSPRLLLSQPHTPLCRPHGLSYANAPTHSDFSPATKANTLLHHCRSVSRPVIVCSKNHVVEAVIEKRRGLFVLCQCFSYPYGCRW